MFHASGLPGMHQSGLGPAPPQDLDKTALRKAALARRAGVPALTRRHFAEVICREGLHLAHRFSAGCVSGFWPIRGEPDCLPLLARLAEEGHATALPVIEPSGRPLLFRRWRMGDPVETLRFGLTEPTAACEAVEPDLVLVPCAAFDRRGHRLGYGRGHYDATLAALRRRKPVVAVALAFSVQEVAAVPHEAHDEPVDFILTEQDLVETGSGHLRSRE